MLMLILGVIFIIISFIMGFTVMYSENSTNADSYFIIAMLILGALGGYFMGAS